MQIGLLIAAVCAGLILATLWLATGGSIFAALGIYVVSGNLLMIGLLIHVIRREL